MCRGEVVADANLHRSFGQPDQDSSPGRGKAVTAGEVLCEVRSLIQISVNSFYQFCFCFCD